MRRRAGECFDTWPMDYETERERIRKRHIERRGESRGCGVGRVAARVRGGEQIRTNRARE